jgi:4-amino-4-deoxy-L-arabinose transferase-like glycosyltransferase
VDSKQDDIKPKDSRVRLAVQVTLLFVLAFGLRWSHQRAAEQTEYPSQLGFLEDARYYASWSEDIAAGQWLSKDSFFMGPLYPYSLAAIRPLASVDLISTEASGTRYDYAHAYLVQAFIGALSCLLLWVLGRRLMGEWQGCLAGFLGAVQPVFIYMDGLLMPSSQALFILLVTLLLLLRAVERRSPWPWLFAGVGIGLATLSKGPSLLLLPGVLLWLSVLVRGVDRGQRARWAGALLLGSLPIIGLASAHNYAADGDLVLVTSNAGPNLWIGNGPQASGAHAGVSTDFPSAKLDFYRFGAERGPQEPPASEVSRRLSAQARAHMGENPGAAAALLWKKFRLFWNAVEIGTNDQFEFFKRYSPVLRFPLGSMGWIAPLGLLGLIVCLGRWRRYWPLHLLVATQALSFTAFFMLGRYRLASVACLILFAVAGVDLVVRSGRAGPRHRVFAGSVALVFGTLFVWWPVDGMSKERGFANQHYLLARAAEEAGRDPGVHYAEALVGDWREGDMSLRQQAVTCLRVGDAQLKGGQRRRALKSYTQGMLAVQQMSPSFRYRIQMRTDLQKRLDVIGG